MNSTALRSSFAALSLAFFAWPAFAIDSTVNSILDVVIQELSPELVPAKPFIVCLIDNGGKVDACIESLAGQAAGSLGKQQLAQAKKALPFDPDGANVKLVIDIVQAAKDEKWDLVIGKGGPYVTRAIVCAVFVPPGLKSFGCPVIGYVIEHQAGLVKSVLGKLKSSDVPGLVSVLISQFGPDVVCELIPSSALPAGASKLKDLGCGVLGEILKAAEEFAKDMADAAVKGADAVENLLFGDDSHMPYEKYEALYWQPWYHYGTWLCLTTNCSGLGGLESGIKSPCVDYFDSHNQYKSTAQKTCGDMASKFDKQARTFSKAMQTAAQIYADTEVAASAKTFAAVDWGRWNTPDRKKLFAQNCQGTMKTKFPLPVPIPGSCEAIKKSPTYKNGLFKTLIDKLYQQCQANAAKQMPSPTAWAYVCQAPADKFAAEYAKAKKDVDESVKKLEPIGCKMGGSVIDSAIATKITCTTYDGFNACKNAFGGKLPCSLDTKNADTALADAILKQVGTKRCKIVDEVKPLPCPKTDGTLGNCPLHEKRILCGRPWKVEKCKELLAQLEVGHPNSTVQCKDDKAGLNAFATLEGQASAIRNKLNGAFGPIGTQAGLGDVKAKSGAGAGSCKTGEPDTLRIYCPGGEFAAHPEISLPVCPVDPNLDGADAPCRTLLLEIHKEQALKAPKPLDPLVGDAYQGPFPGGASKQLPPAMGAPPAMAPPPVLAPTAPAVIGPPPVMMPPPGDPSHATPAAIVPGCTPMSGSPGRYACVTREAHAGCERLRAAGAAAIRQCQIAAGRAH